METIINSLRYKLPAMALAFFATAQAFAQDVVSKSTSSETHTSTNGPAIDDSMWYNAPWVWIVGAAVVLLILFLILRGSSSAADSRSEVTRTTRTTTTVRTD
ncbi:MAG: hypothetical protein V4649_12395 [Bacteroidota bacterium]